ncbi:MAG TPA: DUF4410 domain-containing protein [Thermoanaerobaculia bacterium]|nr:DUF4410 domain-containing protein [Thermoanaerobaculia bacterium]
MSRYLKVRSCFLSLLVWTAAAALCAAGRLDNGLLDPTWFGQDVELHTSARLDYFWVKPGLSLEGARIQIAEWPDPVFLGPKADVDNKDSARAFELSGSMPNWIRGALSNALDGYAEVSKDDGDYALSGRFVDVNAGNKVAKWMVGLGAGAATATWDMKLTDKKTGELVAAIHHRSVSGTHMSDIDDKILKWLSKDFGPAVRQNFSDYPTTKAARK